MPPDSTHVDEEGVLLDNVQLVAEGASSKRRCARILASRPLSVAQCRPEPGRPARAGRGVREGRVEAGQDGRALQPAGRSAPTCSTCRTTPRKSVRRVLDVLTDGRLRIRDGQRREGRRRDLDRQGQARGDDRFHRHQRAAADQLQRAVRGLQGRGALRVPHAGRRRNSDERRLPEAAAHRHSRRLDA